MVTGDNLMPLTNTETPRAGAGKRAALSPHEETAMQKAGTIPQHNYVRKIHQMWETGAIPREVGYHHLVIEHDDWCGIWTGQRCHCDPDIRLKFSLTGHRN